MKVYALNKVLCISTIPENNIGAPKILNNLVQVGQDAIFMHLKRKYHMFFLYKYLHSPSILTICEFK